MRIKPWQAVVGGFALALVARGLKPAYPIPTSYERASNPGTGPGGIVGPPGFIYGGRGMSRPQIQNPATARVPNLF